MYVSKASQERYVIVDGSYYMHSFFYAYKNRYNAQGQPTGALYGFTKMLLTLPAKWKTSNIAIVFDGPKSSHERRKLDPSYKQNRPSMDLELSEQFRQINSVISQLGFTSYIVSGYEGDDVIGTLVDFYSKKNNSSVFIMSRDKDMMQLIQKNVSVLWNQELINYHNFLTYHTIHPNQFRDFLALCGDKSDNIPGVPGVGPKTASILLKKYNCIDGILESTSLVDVSFKVNQNIKKYSERLHLSRKLATINCQVPINPIKNIRLRWSKKRISAVKDLFTQFGFYSLVSRLDSFDIY